MKALKLAATLLSTLVLAAIGTTSVAAADHETLVSGFEMYATSNQGNFAGTASPGSTNGLSGAWSIVVYHTPLGSGNCDGTPCAQIIQDSSHDSSFGLAETSPAVELVTGKFDPQGQGTPGIVEVSPYSTCGTQRFHITDTLSSVGTGSQHSGRGRFDADLWHYRHSIFGRCITYAATVKGTVFLSF